MRMWPFLIRKRTGGFSPTTLHNPVDWFPCAGETLYSMAEQVILRGKRIVAGENLPAEAGYGTFLSRNGLRGETV